MKVRKAVFPAAGLGTRFLPATKAQPKEMLPLVDKPTIQYVVEEAVASGLSEIIIVTGRNKRAIEDHFDAAFFGVNPREALAMDPQQRLLLETAWEALEHAGLPLERLSGSRTGVFIGISTGDYARIQASPTQLRELSAFTAQGTSLSIAANRISYCFDLRGPSIAVDTACSSSLVSVHLACRSLWANDIGLALAGGVNCMLSPETTIGFSRATMLSPSGRCMTFDAGADGYLTKPVPPPELLARVKNGFRQRDAVIAAIKKDLTEDQRHVIILRFLEGFSLRETADIMGKEVYNVKVIQNRGVAKLRKALEYKVA